MAPVRNNELTPVNIHTSEFTPKIEGKSYSQTKYFERNKLMLNDDDKLAQ